MQKYKKKIIMPLSHEKFVLLHAESKENKQ